MDEMVEIPGRFLYHPTQEMARPREQFPHWFSHKRLLSGNKDEENFVAQAHC
jgi:hypothetical protein